MKKRILIVAVLAICIGILASETLAFFTAEAKADNVITTDGVSIQLVEKHKDESGALVDFPERIDGVMPGCSVSKIVTVTNIEAEAWIRVSVEKKVTAADGSALPTDLVTFQIDETKWLEKDGYYYYRTPVATGESTDILFDEVQFSGQMGNEYQGCEIYISVRAEAVQTANNGTTVEEAAGWSAA